MCCRRRGPGRLHIADTCGTDSQLHRAGTTTAPARGSLTGSQMAAIVTATMATNNRANRSIDLSLLKTYEGGSALAIDAASYVESAKTPSSACSYPPFGITVLETVALGGTSYPRRFGTSRPLAPPKVLGQSSPPERRLAVRVRAVGSWRALEDHPRAIGGHRQGRRPRQRRFAGSTSFSAGIGRGRALAGSVGVRSRQLRDDRAPRSPERPRVRGRAASCSRTPRGGLRAVREERCDRTAGLSPAADRVTAPLTSGGTLSLFTLNFVTTLVPTAADGSIEWVSVPSAEPVTGLLPTGQYSRIVQHGVLELAVTTSRAGVSPSRGLLRGDLDHRYEGFDRPGLRGRCPRVGREQLRLGPTPVPPQPAAKLGSQPARSVSKRSISPRC